MIFNQHLELKTFFVHQSYSYILVKVLKSCVYKYYKAFYRLDLQFGENRQDINFIIVKYNFFSVHCPIDTFV